MNFSDPLGLCTDKDGKPLPPDQCRDITAAEGKSVYKQASGSRNEWKYTEAVHEKAQKVGDCTDLVEYSMEAAGFPSLGTTANNGAPRTGDFPSSDYRELGPDEQPREGDVVIQGGPGGHAGIFSGRYVSGHPMVMQNGDHGARIIPFYQGEKDMPNGQPVFFRRQVPIGG